MVASKDMSSVNIGEAKSHFSELLARVQAGESIIIARAGKPIAVLAPYSESPKRRPLGMDDGKVWMSEDFDDPLPEFEDYM